MSANVPETQYAQPNTEEPLPKFCCCNVKIAIYCYFAFCFVSICAAFVLHGSGWLALALLLFNVFAVYQESPLLLKVAAALDVSGVLVMDILLAVMVGLLNQDPIKFQNNVLSNDPNFPKTYITQDLNAATDLIKYALIGSVVLQNILNLVLVVFIKKLWNYIERRNALKPSEV